MERVKKSVKKNSSQPAENKKKPVDIWKKKEIEYRNKSREFYSRKGKTEKKYYASEKKNRESTMGILEETAMTEEGIKERIYPVILR